MLWLLLPAIGLFPNTTPPRDVTIVGLDYAFELPRELPAGRMTFVS